MPVGQGDGWKAGGSTIHGLALENALEAFNKNGDRASLQASQALDKLIWEERANVPPRR